MTAGKPNRPISKVVSGSHVGLRHRLQPYSGIRRSPPNAVEACWRREWDSNPRYPGGTTVFETVRFGHSRIPPAGTLP